MWANLLDIIYPVGSIYCSTLSTSPASTIGGTWRQIEDAVLRSSIGESGYSGSDTHSITIDEMPEHTHTNFSVSGSVLKWVNGTIPNATASSYRGSIGPWNQDTENIIVNPTGGGASYIACSTLLQLLYLVPSRLVAFIEVM